MWMGGIAACVVCVVLSCLKGVGAEKRKFVGYLEHESWSVHECDWVERAVMNSSGRVLSSTEAQEQGEKAPPCFKDPSRNAFWVLSVSPSLFGFQV